MKKDTILFQFKSGNRFEVGHLSLECKEEDIQRKFLTIKKIMNDGKAIAIETNNIFIKIDDIDFISYQNEKLRPPK